MLVCISVHYGFTVEIYGVSHSLHTCLACDAHDAIAMEVALRTRRIEDDTGTSTEI